MSRRRPRVAIALGVLLTLGAVAVLMQAEPAIEASRAGPAVAEATSARPGAGTVLPVPRAGAVAPLDASPPPTPRPDPDREPRPAAEVDVVPRKPLLDLVRELEEIEARRPLDFHYGATAALGEWLQLDDPAAEREGCRQLLDELNLSERVRGALLALLGAWGDREGALRRAGARGETWRSTVLGLGCGSSRAGAGPGTTLELERVFSKLVPVQGKALLLDPARIPDPELQAELVAAAESLVDDLDPWLSRVIAVLALGPALDERPELVDLFTRLLFDTSPWGLQVRVPVCYAMSQAKSDGIRDALVEFLADDQVGPHGKHLARWWMGDRMALPHELEALSAPLRDDGAEHLEKVGAIGGLLKQVAGAEGEVLEALEEILTSCLEQESDRTIRLALVTTLADLDGGDRKLEQLGHVLRFDEHSTARLWAAKGLGHFRGTLAVQARAMLELALVDEATPSVRRAIEAALEQLS